MTDFKANKLKKKGERIFNIITFLAVASLWLSIIIAIAKSF